jgi:hypothetical protein
MFHFTAPVLGHVEENQPFKRQVHRHVIPARDHFEESGNRHNPDTNQQSSRFQRFQHKPRDEIRESNQQTSNFQRFERFQHKPRDESPNFQFLQTFNQPKPQNPSFHQSHQTLETDEDDDFQESNQQNSNNFQFLQTFQHNQPHDANNQDFSNFQHQQDSFESYEDEDSSFQNQQHLEPYSQPQVEYEPNQYVPTTPRNDVFFQANSGDFVDSEEENQPLNVQPNTWIPLSQRPQRPFHESSPPIKRHPSRRRVVRVKRLLPTRIPQTTTGLERRGESFGENFETNTNQQSPDNYFYFHMPAHNVAIDSAYNTPENQPQSSDFKGNSFSKDDFVAPTPFSKFHEAIEHNTEEPNFFIRGHHNAPNNNFFEKEVTKSIPNAFDSNGNSEQYFTMNHHSSFDSPKPVKESFRSQPPNWKPPLKQHQHFVDFSVPPQSSKPFTKWPNTPSSFGHNDNNHKNGFSAPPQLQHLTSQWNSKPSESGSSFTFTPPENFFSKQVSNFQNADDFIEHSHVEVNDDDAGFSGFPKHVLKWNSEPNQIEFSSNAGGQTYENEPETIDQSQYSHSPKQQSHADLTFTDFSVPTTSNKMTKNSLFKDENQFSSPKKQRSPEKSILLQKPELITQDYATIKAPKLLRPNPTKSSITGPNQFTEYVVSDEVVDEDVHFADSYEDFDFLDRADAKKGNNPTSAQDRNGEDMTLQDAEFNALGFLERYDIWDSLQESINSVSKEKSTEARCPPKVLSKFPICDKHLPSCSKQETPKNGPQNRVQLASFASCLIENYPEVRNVVQDNSIPVQSTTPRAIKGLKFRNDEDCTKFIHVFFAKCLFHLAPWSSWTRKRLYRFWDV